ncbi:MAG TPA: glycosyltransferase family 39 protein, partial [Chloroflexota bacterium]|nr:glycosyltransferase family 39 protein [Chloroflexota bacterium]
MQLRDLNAAPATKALRLNRGALIGGCVVVLAAFATRVWQLGAQSFWWDEAYSATVSREGLREIVATLAREDFHPPLHYFFLHYWLMLVGQSEFALRYSSVLAGVLAVAAAWTTATRFFGRGAAPIVAALFAASPYLWYYSRETRMFALIPAFSVLAVYCCARATDEGHARWWFGYAAFVALGLYDLYYAIFLPFVCGLWLLITRIGSRKPSALGRGRQGTAPTPALPVHGEGEDRFPPVDGGTGGPAGLPPWTGGLRGGTSLVADLLPWASATAAAFLVYLPWVPILVYRTRVWTSAFAPENGPLKVITWTWTDFILGLPTLELYQQPGTAALLGAAGLATVAAVGWAWWLRGRNPRALLVALAFLCPLLA